jgi:hypothetical protein
MKAKRKIQALRALAIAGSMSALIVPTAALARPATEIPVRSENSVGTAAQQQPSFQLRRTFHTEVQTASTPAQQHAYQLPSSFKPEVQTPSTPAQQHAYQLPSSYKPEVQTPSSPTVASSPGSVIREIRTVTDDGSPTLAIVLAAIALAIALCGSAYAWVRLTRMQREFSSRPLVG